MSTLSGIPEENLELCKVWTSKNFFFVPCLCCADYHILHIHLHSLKFTIYNPGQNVLGNLRKLGTKTHFVKLTHILPLKKAWGCCYKGLFLLSPSSPSGVNCAELKLECITLTLHRGGRGKGRCLNLMSYCLSVPRVLTRVVAILYMMCWIITHSKFVLIFIKWYKLGSGSPYYCSY